MKTFIKYPGGKTKELPLINKYKPSNIKRYFEPFLGGGSVFFDLNIKKSFINDFSKDLICLFKFLKTNNLEFKNILKRINKLWIRLEKEDYEVYLKASSLIDIRKFNQYYLISYARKETTIKNLHIKSYLDRKKMKETARKTAFYMVIRDIYNETNDILKRVASYYFLREYCYSSMFRFSNDGKFNVPYGGISYNKKHLTKKIDYMFSKPILSLLSTTKIDNKDFEVFLKQFEFNESDFIFLDPPYDSEFSTYDKNTFEKKEQIRLKNYLSKTKANWMLIIKKTDFISKLYKGFYVYEYSNKYMVSFKNRNKKDINHLLITNYKIKE